MARLFVAVWPPEEVVETLRELRRKDERGARFVLPENWHITLRFLGEADPDEAREALDSGRYPAATARLGPGVDVLKGHSVVVPVAGVDPLAATVAELTKDLGTEPARKRFIGHLTLARLKRHARPPLVTGSHVIAVFDIDEIALVQSSLKPNGVQYTTLGTWPTS